MKRDPRMPGPWVPAIAILAGAALLAALVPALGSGGLLNEGRRIADLAWGRMLLVDVYAGMALFAAWIGWRERPWPAFAWIAALLVVGNLVACLYVARTWLAARADGASFWHGPRGSAHRERAR